MIIKSVVRIDKKTKELVKRLNADEIAVINHRDIDEVAAHSLVACKPMLIINAEQSISGRYPNLGPGILIRAGLPVLDNVGQDVFEMLREDDILEVYDNEIYRDGEYIGSGVILDESIIQMKLEETEKNFAIELDKFIENTLEYAKKEKNFFLGKLKIPDMDTSFKGRHALVVVRGQDYKEDLMAIKFYIEEFSPVLIGVDGGGDALLEFGYKPDIIVGDMDSVSDKCLMNCKEIIVHAYPDGRAPGQARVEDLGLESIIFPAPGTSEDIAMLLAFDRGADLIVAVGTHSNMIDFLEKGRKGMASTFLVRLKIGSKLIDAKGVNKLYRESIKFKYLVGLVFGALIPVFIVSFMSPPVQQLLKLLQIRLKFIFGL